MQSKAYPETVGRRSCEPNVCPIAGGQFATVSKKAWAYSVHLNLTEIKNSKMQKKVTVFKIWSTSWVAVFSVLFALMSAKPAFGIMPDSFDYSPRVEALEIIPPKYLYHWVGMKNLLKWTDSIKRSGELIFPVPLMPNSGFVKAWPQFAGARGVFAWVNPIPGSMGGTGEIYGQSEALVRFEVNPAKARAIRIVSSGDTIGDIGNLDLTQVDLVEHVTPSRQEWIILRPLNIVSYTADSKVLLPEVMAKLEELRSQSPKLPLAELHTALGLRQIGNGPTTDFVYPHLMEFWQKNVEYYQKLAQLHGEEFAAFKFSIMPAHRECRDLF